MLLMPLLYRLIILCLVYTNIHILFKKKKFYWFIIYLYYLQVEYVENLCFKFLLKPLTTERELLYISTYDEPILRKIAYFFSHQNMRSSRRADDVHLQDGTHI